MATIGHLSLICFDGGHDLQPKMQYTFDVNAVNMCKYIVVKIVPADICLCRVMVCGPGVLNRPHPE